MRKFVKLKKLSGFQRFAAIVAGGFGCVFGLELLPETLFLKRYQKIVSFYKDGQMQPLPAEMESFSFKIADKMGMSNKKLSRLKFFTCYGFDPLHLGGMTFKTGAVIGIPSHFLWATEADLPRDSIKVCNQAVDWTQQDAQVLLDSLQLSEKAKAFSIARELYYVNSNSIITNSFIWALFLSGTYGAGKLVNGLFIPPAKQSRKTQLFVFAIASPLAFLLFLLGKDFFSCRRDNRVDNQAASLGLQYAEGGVEYYAKLLERNKSLRVLMGTAGPKRYTLYGNHTYKVRRSTVPLTERLDNLKTILTQKNHQPDEAK